MHTACADLGLHRHWVVHPGSERYPLADHMEAVRLFGIPALLDSFRLRDRI